MGYFILKIILTACIVAFVSELSRRYSLAAAVIASLPLISLLSIIWIYIETRDIQRLTELSYNIFWMVLPSLAFFLIFPALLKQGVVFWVSILIASSFTALLYGVAIRLLQ
ncbi:MAG TPA: hypothetical protein DCZ03_04795 [Gammaproteobacteria bacterium]|nr:hypothetical protein [Gammaproteobacteria bacterium]